jgi:protein KIBRA
LEDPRQEWRAIQEAMLREYLQTAQDVLEAKKDIYHVKSQRLMLAQDEYNHLNNALANLATSRTSLYSSVSGVSTKYDPDLLKSDVALAKNRVSRLKSELEQIRNEMRYTQKGVDTLTNVEQKLNSHQGYNIVEAQAIMAELVNIQKSLSSGEKEKAELMQSLAKLKDDLTRLQLSEGSPDVSTLSLPQEKLSTASQTDLSCELVPIGTRLAEMAKMRLEYDEARKQVQHIQQKLADLEEKVQPGQVESDRDRLLLFQEKEQLLRELRSITPRMRSKEEMSGIQLECKRLEQDLNKALEMSNRAISDRLRLHEEKQLLLQQLRDALRQMTHLESHLKTLSASTLSVSSSSSLGSLSTTSSKGSLSSGLSFTDIYGGPQCSTSGPNLDKPIDMLDLHRRVERVLKVKYSTPSPCRSQPSLSPRSSLSSVSPPVSPMYENLPCTVPPPTYEQVERDRQVQRLIEELGHQEPQNPGPKLSRYSYESSGDPPLSPISETPPPMLDHDGTALSRTSSSGTNTRSVSAAVSDESVAGDSGVFEASNRKKLLQEQDVDTAQVQIKLRYAPNESILNVCVERARNLCALYIVENAQVYIKIALLPATPPLPSVYCTKPVRDLKKPSFGDIFNISVPANKICTKTLQLNVWSKTDQDQEKCVGCAQVSLADFNIQQASQKWYNILSLQLIDTREEPKPGHNRQESDVSRHEPNDSSAKQPVLKEESSDDSTIISSQTSTLTRNQDPMNFLSTVNFTLEDLYSCMDRESEEESEEEIEEEEEEDVLEVLDEEIEAFSDKQTNTECAFYPEHAKQMKLAAAGNALDDRGVIKRSQTFTPSAHVSKNQYICKLNRSDSDSAMPLYRRGGKPFERNAIERRSLRFRRQSVTARPQTHLPTTARTSLDLELDLQAQHTRLDLLHSELLRLRELKAKLEGAKERGDTELASYLLEDERFQNLIAHAESFRCPKTPEEKKVEKMLKKVSKEIYKLRKTKAGNGKPDIISFKEKMAFFTRVNTNVPFLPSDECHSEVSKTKDEPPSNSDDCEVMKGGVEDEQSGQTERYEYVVDRVLGVEV